MGQVISNLSMSLDGFIEDARGSVEKLFGWYTTGPVETKVANPDVRFHQSAEDAEFFRETIATIGALIAGRRLFDAAPAPRTSPTCRRRRSDRTTRPSAAAIGSPTSAIPSCAAPSR